MIVDLAVEHDPDVGATHRQRLQARVGEIEDRQPTVPEAQGDRSAGTPRVGGGQNGVPEPAPPAIRPPEQVPLAVGPPVQLPIVHALQGGHVDWTGEANDPYDPAHRAATPAGSPRWRVSQGSNRCTAIKPAGVKNYAHRRVHRPRADLWRAHHTRSLPKTPSPGEARVASPSWAGRCWRAPYGYRITSVGLVRSGRISAAARGAGPGGPHARQGPP